MSEIRICLLGRVEISCGEKTADGLDTGRALELLCFLLLNRTRTHPREVLADMLWGESPTARRYLRKTLWQLQTCLDTLTGSVGQDRNGLLEVNPDSIQLDTGALFWLDIAVFEQVFSQLVDVPGHALDGPIARATNDAVALYHGELLSGWYQDWCLFERERFRHMYLAMLDKLMAHYGSRGMNETGVQCAMRILQHEPTREQTHRWLMRLFYEMGDRNAALHQYEICAVALREKLDLVPSERTDQLYRRIRSGRRIDIQTSTNQPIIDASNMHEGNGNGSNSARTPAPKSDPVEKMRALIDDFQRQAEEHLKALEDLSRE